MRERLEKEQIEKERARKEKEESHLYTIIKVARDSDMRAQIGNDQHFDLVDHDKVTPPHAFLPASVFNVKSMHEKLAWACLKTKTPRQ